MLNELEQKIRKAIPELRDWDYIQLNNVLEYVINVLELEEWVVLKICWDWNLKSNLLSDQNKVLIKFVNEL